MSNTIDSYKGAWLAAYSALKRNIPFALYILPNRERPEFICQIDGREPKSSTTFKIVPWNEKFRDGIVIKDTISAKDFLKNLSDFHVEVETEYDPWTESTNKLVYKGQVLSAINVLDESYGGKIVLSRVICSSLEHAKDPFWAVIHTLTLLHGNSPETFGFLYFTPQTGCWLGASPELLLDFNKGGGYSHTMALAGTRKRSFSKIPDEVWDDKNVYEHNLVMDYIIGSLQELGVGTIEERECVKSYGSVEHICHEIRFIPEQVVAPTILDKLSPTPALGGFPKTLAIDFISHYELHPRRCYGGYVVVEDDKKTLAYVNLRCANANKDSVCIYSGGGITSDSKPDAEWEETELKASSMREFLKISCNLVNLEIK